jgi:uncharacterized protein YegJ (DUF2314 family)
MGRCAVGLIVLALMVAAWRNQRWSDKFTQVADDDPRMNTAIDKARSTVDAFIAALNSPKSGQSQFSIKMAFTDGDHTEHMWLTPVRYDGKTFRGTLSNEPRTVRTVMMGQGATVSASEISDWMYLENGKLVGAYTLRVLRDTLAPAERREFDRNVQFIDE